MRNSCVLITERRKKLNRRIREGRGNGKEQTKGKKEQREVEEEEKRMENERPNELM